MNALRRVAAMTGALTVRTFRSPINVLWMLVVPIIFSLVIGAFFSSMGDGPLSVTGDPNAYQHVIRESPQGREGDDGFPRVRGIFGVYIVFAWSALITRGSALHSERADGTLQRIVVSGVPYGEVVSAHLASIFLVGAVQSVVFFAVTGAFGTRWFASGWIEPVLAVAGTLFVGAGVAVGLSGLVRSPNAIQGLGGGVPPALAIAGGAFFPLEVAPAALQQLARFNPVYWAMEALDGGMIYQGVVSQVAPLAVLLLVGVLSMIIGIQGLRLLEL